MHLSKIVVPWHKAHNPYNIHRQLWHLFPGRSSENRKFLFRIEKQASDLGSEIIMQSVHKPTVADRGVHVAATREFNLSLHDNQSLRFRIRANPVKTIVDEKGRVNRKGEPKKCRVPLIREEEQRHWLDRKLERICMLETLIINNEPPFYFRKPKEQRTGKIQTVLYDGILKVIDPQKFIQLIKEGIGPAKAFGCGLLSVARR